MATEQRSRLAEWTAMVRAGRMSRRAFLEGAAALGVGMGSAMTLLEGCGPTNTAGTDIAYWNLFGGGDGVRMIQMENDFSKAHPNINLQSVTLAWGDPYYTKLAMASAGGRPPDVAISHMTRVATYAAQNLLDPFDMDELAQHGITTSNFLAPILQRAQHFGKVYAIPLDTHPFVLYYNTDLCRKAGLLDSSGNLKPIQGANAFVEASKAIKQETGQYATVFEVQGVTPWRIFSTLYAQLGGQVLSPDGKELVLDNAKAEQALTFVRDLAANKLAAQNIDYAGSVALFGGGKSAFMWNGEWEVTTFQSQKNFAFNMVPFPLIFNQYRVQADSHSFVLPHQVAVDPAKRSAALEFISFMLKDSYTWSQGGHVPAYLPVTESAQYKSLKPQSNYAGVAADVVVDPNAWFSGSGSELENQTGTIFAPVINGNATVKQGLSQFRAAVEKLLSVKLPFQQ
jgi:multiple sugar transport system substrate-binding protein